MATYCLPRNFPDHLGISNIITNDSGVVINAPFSIDDIDFTIAGGHNIYYVDYANGSDSNDGLTEGAAFKTYNHAFTVADNQDSEIVLLDDWIGQLSITNDISDTTQFNLKLRGNGAGGRTLITQKNESYVGTFDWTDNTDGTFSSSTNVEDFPACFDNLYQDSDGIAAPMTSVASGEDCVSTPGSFFWDGVDTLMVHMQDDREPDDDWIYCPAAFFGRPNIAVGTNGKTVILENLTIYNNEGSTARGNIWVRGNGHTGTTQIGMKNVRAAGASQDGLELSNARIAIAQNCVVKYTRADGIDYGVTSGDGQGMTAYEINCKTRNTGYDGVFQDQPALGASANGSTAHDGISIVRINGDYADSNGPIVSDISADSWLFGCVAEGTTIAGSGESNSAYYIQGSALNGRERMVLIECAGSDETSGGGDAHTMSADTSSVASIFYRSWVGTEPVDTNGSVIESTTIGNCLVNVIETYRGAVEPLESGASGNEIRLWRGAVEPAYTAISDALIGGVTKSVTRGLTRGVTEGWDWGT